MIVKLLEVGDRLLLKKREVEEVEILRVDEKRAYTKDAILRREFEEYSTAMYRPNPISDGTYWLDTPENRKHFNYNPQKSGK
jgi:tRNA(Met) C34 N-acetyltransferase TmcA